MRSAEQIIRGVLRPGGSLLELGCGSGLLARRLAGCFGRYHGIDIAEAAISHARNMPGLGHATFEQGDVLEAKLPVSDVAVFLGLIDWLEPAEARSLLARIPARYLVFSFTAKGAGASPLSPYGIYRTWYDRQFGGGVYRARSFGWTEVREWLEPLRPRHAELVGTTWLDPGRMVLVERAE